MVQAMLRWMRELPTITIPAQISISLMEEIKNKVSQETFKGCVIKEGEHSIWEASTSIYNEAISGTRAIEGSQTGGRSWTFQASVQNKEVIIVADNANMEALATGLVLSKFVSKHTSHDVSAMSGVLRQQQRFVDHPSWNWHDGKPRQNIYIHIYI